jgi:hypothetical protein
MRKWPRRKIVKRNWPTDNPDVGIRKLKTSTVLNTLKEIEDNANKVTNWYFRTERIN